MKLTCALNKAPTKHHFSLYFGKRFSKHQHALAPARLTRKLLVLLKTPVSTLLTDATVHRIKTSLFSQELGHDSDKAYGLSRRYICSSGIKSPKYLSIRIPSDKKQYATFFAIANRRPPNSKFQMPKKLYLDRFNWEKWLILQVNYTNLSKIDFQTGRRQKTRQASLEEIEVLRQWLFS